MLKAAKYTLSRNSKYQCMLALLPASVITGLVVYAFSFTPGCGRPNSPKCAPGAHDGDTAAEVVLAFAAATFLACVTMGFLGLLHCWAKDYKEKTATLLPSNNEGGKSSAIVSSANNSHSTFAPPHAIATRSSLAQFSPNNPQDNDVPGAAPATIS